MCRRSILSYTAIFALAFFATQSTAFSREGRRGAFLSTSGSFTLSSGGGNDAGNSEELMMQAEEEDDEHENNIDIEEENIWVGARRAAFLSTSGSYTLSSGGSSNTGNSEDIEE